MARIYQHSLLAQEEGTYIIKYIFKDEAKQILEASNITSLFWWLTNFSGKVINGRSAVEITSITNPYYLVIYGDDLQILDKAAGQENRVVTLKGTYNSTYGNNLPFTYAESFGIINQLVIAADLNISAADAIFSADFIYV
jgi:hypothetical protein